MIFKTRSLSFFVPTTQRCLFNAQVQRKRTEAKIWYKSFFESCFQNWLFPSLFKFRASTKKTELLITGYTDPSVGHFYTRVNEAKKNLIVKAIPCFLLFQVVVEVYWQRLKESLCHQVTQLGILQTQHADGQSLYQTTIMWSDLQSTEFTLRRIETARKLLSYEHNYGQRISVKRLVL